MAQNASRFVDFEQGGGNVRLIAASQPIAVHNADKGCKGIDRACGDLCKDIGAATGASARIDANGYQDAKIVVATIGGKSDFVKQLIKKKQIDPKQLEGLENDCGCKVKVRKME